MADILDQIADAVATRNTAAAKAAVDLARAQADLAAAQTKIADLTVALAACQSGSNPSGQPMPVGDLTGWKQIFTDDFTINVPLGQFPAAVSSKWGAYPTAYKDTSKNGTYDPARTISIANSVMRIHMHTDAAGVIRVSAPVPYIKPPTSTMIWPGQLYGRYSTRARFLNLAPGFKVAWLLWPDSGTNTSGSPDGVGGNGEIDYPEHNLSQRSKTSAFMHYQNATIGTDQYAASITTDLSQWHTYTTEWSANLCKFLLDGAVFGQATTRVPKTAMHWVIQCETEIGSGATRPAPATVADIEIDWVAIWAKA